VVEEREAPALARVCCLGEGPAGRRCCRFVQVQAWRLRRAEWGERARRQGGEPSDVEGDFDDDGDGARRGGKDEVGHDVDGEPVGGVVDVADEALGDGGDSILGAGCGGDDLQRTAGTLADAAKTSRSKSSTSSGGAWWSDFAGGNGLALFSRSGLGRLGQDWTWIRPVDGIGPAPFCATPGRSA